MLRALRASVICIVISMAMVCIMAQASASEEKVNINTASKEILITLKYVGEKIADRIIAYRQADPFEVPEDIMKVKGIGPKVFEANKGVITVKDG